MYKLIYTSIHMNISTHLRYINIYSDVYRYRYTYV